MTAREQHRRRIIGNARRLLSEIRQMHIDADSWNENVRKPDEAPINPDPDGDMARIALYCERVIRQGP